MDLPNCGTTHDRNLNAAINLRNLLRNLIMPAGRSRDGPGQEVVSTEVPASRWGHLGSVIVPQQPNLPHPPDRERHTVP